MSIPDWGIEKTNGRDADRPVFRPHIVARCMGDVEAMDISWVWINKIPHGRLTVLAGDGGVGKSFLTLAIASTVSTGARWPDGEPNSGPGSVVILNAEDDPGDTIRKRLDACGADVRRVYTVDGVKRRHDGEVDYFSLVDDLRALEEKIIEVGAKLCIVDPLGAYLPGIDSHKDSEVRTVLGPLAALAQRTDCAILTVAHVTKAQTSKAAHKVGGSLAFTNAARMCWLIARDPEDERRRLMLPYKFNIIEKPSGIGFIIEDGAVRWLAGEVTETAESVLNMECIAQDDRSKVSEVVEWLASLLARGPMDVREIERTAKAECHSWRTVERAKKLLDVKSDRVGYGKGGRFDWRLPAIDRQPDFQPVGG